MADPKSPVIPAEHFNSLFTVLRARGFRIISPTMRSGAVVLDDLESVSDLPAGWTDSQEPGVYRLTPTSTDAIFTHGAFANTWKERLYPPLVQLFEAFPDRLSLSLMQTMKLLNSIPKTNISPATLSVLNFKVMYSTYCLRWMWKEITFGLLPPTAQTRKSGRIASKSGGTLHEMPCVWI
jgi:hypothetical protein